MSIQDIRQKINTYIDEEQLVWVISAYGVVFLIMGLVGLSLHVQKTEGIELTTFNAPVLEENTTASLAIGETVYASKSGEKYYFKDCAGLTRIKPENMISFASVALAEQAGYTKAANCH